MKTLRRTRIVPFVLLVLLVLITSSTSTVKPSSVGLILKYRVNDDIAGEWDEQFEILEAVSEQDNSVFLIEVSSTGENVSQGSLLLDTSSWELFDVNGTGLDQPLQPPLWVDTSTWRVGDTVHLPTYSGIFHLSSEFVSLAFGTFHCWRVHSVAWFSIDDDYQISSENWFFLYAQGILIKHTFEILASQHAIYSYKLTRELIESNFQNYGILSLQDQTLLFIQNLELVIFSFLTLLGAVFIYRYLRRSRFRQIPRVTSV